ncbi:MAG: hypothetical protein KJP00_09510 [Bacteroidia bacterium]|nr:hypothetical protein [Bacteroidia bacterium]
MLTFLRRIRKSLIETGSTRKYILYAIGEILLVVIGILIALQINTWNEERKARIREVKLLKELKSNLLVNQHRLSQQIDEETTYFNSAKIIVNHLDQQLPYHDSLATHFELSQLSADIVLTSSAYEAIKSLGFDIISNDTLRSAIIDLFDTNYATMIRNTIGLEDQFWPAVTLKPWIKHLRHKSMDEERPGLVPINYAALLRDVEFRSMLEKRGLFRRQGAELKTESLKQTEALIAQIDRELIRD